MTSDYPTPLMSAPPQPRTLASSVSSSAHKSRAGAPTGAWHYPVPPRSRRRLALAIVISAAFHVALFMGVRSHPKVTVRADEEKLIAITIAMPDLKDLEEPEPLPKDDLAEKIDPGEYAPTLMDAPQIALPTDFIQELNFASLLPKPDLDQAKVFVIPHHIGSGKLGEGLTNIFNLVDLDRVPEPVVQPSPIFPFELKREVSTARVLVEFIVDTDGRVRNPMAVEDTHPGFVAAAIAGVEKWRFRPGMKGGRKVNTRMSVPIIFRISDPTS